MVLSLVYRALDDGVPVIIDELDASLHTLASEAVVQLFCSRETNPNGAQLIATTHDTNLLASQMLRRDQVWFTEKDEYGATLLFPLTEIRTRSGDNFEKGYLQGRYGATTGIRERSRESPDCKDLVTRVEKAEQRAEVQLEKRTEHDDSFGNPSTTAGRLTYEIRLADKRATRSDSQSPPLPPAFGARHLPGRQP